MARPCSCCTHPDRGEIDKALVAGDPLRHVAERYGMSATALFRHKNEHLPAVLLEARQRQEIAEASGHVTAIGEQIQQRQAEEQERALDVITELRRCFHRVNKLFDACDRWLTDPNNVEQYDIGPRAEELQVTYTQWIESDGRKVPDRKKEPLATILARIEATGLEIDRVESKHADPRQLVLNAAAQLTKQTELLAKLLGELDERPQFNVLIAPEWQTMRATILAALAPYPEARIAVATKLIEVDHASAG
jgi:hypothetical protein